MRGTKQSGRSSSFALRCGLLAAVVAASAVAAAGLLACASSGPSDEDEDHYLRYVAFEVPINERVLLRWPTERMPLRIHLPRPPEGLFEDPEADFDSVHDGVLHWTDVAAPGVPSFVFVDDAGEADIPIVWEVAPVQQYYVAHVVYDMRPLARRFGVARILVTGRWRPDYVADLHDLYVIMLHEMGHALGLGGHSPDPNDVMYPRAPRTPTPGLSERDRATLRALYARPIGTRIVGARRAR